MKSGTKVLVAILGGLALIGGSIYAYIKKQTDLLYDFDWKLLDVSFDKVNLQLVKGKVKFRFFNKADIQVVVTKFYLKLYLNKEEVGYIEDVQEFVIPARGFNDISFSYTINPQFLVKNITNIVLGSVSSKDATLTLDGYAKIRSGFIRVTVPILCDCSVKNYDCNC